MEVMVQTDYMDKMIMITFMEVGAQTIFMVITGTIG